MNNYSIKKTIYAPASAPQKSGIIVVRVSGRATLDVAIKLRLPELEPRYATLSNIYHPRTGDLIDNVIAVYYKAPHSFTGEDVLEISIHGGRAVLKSLLDALSLIPGLRFAEPGEFSMRALFNDKLDLTQLEGLSDLINAETAEQHKLAIKQLSGHLSEIYEAWRKKLLAIMGLIEAHIDFPEEDIPDDLVEKASRAVEELNVEMKSYLQDNRVGEKLRDGLYITILGQPNVGKSSLINKISKRDVAIVSSTAGTTRDVIEVELDIKGYPVILADTAGIRETSEEIETEGIKRALDRARRADCKLVMIDATDTMHPAEILELIDSNTILVSSKIDLLPSKPVEQSIKDRQIIFISTTTGEGLEALISKLSSFTEEFFHSNLSTPLITRERHRKHLSNCSEALTRFSMTGEIEFAAEDLRLAASYLSHITERIDADSILGEIFSNFCIGK
jgi:tRNA modification GTPase